MGRDRQLLTLAGLLDGSLPERVVVIQGEAGIGKTAMLDALAERATAAGKLVAAGRAHRFGSDSASYLPLLDVLRALESTLGPRVPGLSALTASLDTATPVPEGPAGYPGRLVREVGIAISRAAKAARGLIAVIDDLQWADPTTLEVLAFIADTPELERGPDGVGLVLAFRDEGLSDGHPLHSWLVDLRKAVPVRVLPLRRLSFDDTAEQVVDRLGAGALSKVGDVFARSAGNPYLTDLLCRHQTDEVSKPPDEDVESTLRAVLLSSWHRLSPTGRQVTRAVSIAGRPSPADVLARGAAAFGVSTAEAESALREGVTSGLLVQDESGNMWFRHPLTAEILESTLMPAETARLHLAFAAELERRPIHRHAAADRALHMAAAGEPRVAFDLCLEASELEVGRGSLDEAANLHRRATQLWEVLDSGERRPDLTHSGLLADLAELLTQLGDFDGAARTIDHACDVRDEIGDPVTAGRVLRLRTQIRRYAGRSEAPDLEACRGAVALTSAAHGGLEHVSALAAYSDELRFAGDIDAALAIADEAVCVAGADGDPLARSRALMARLCASPTPADREALQRAAAVADSTATMRVRSEVTVVSTQQIGFILQNDGDWAGCVAQFRMAFEAASSAGATAVAQSLGGYLAQFLIPLGEVTEARETLRLVLASRPTGMCGVVAHTQALLLAVRAGDEERSDLHLRWLGDLVDDFTDFVGLWGPTVLAEHHLAHGRPRAALELMRERIWEHGRFEPLYGDLMLAKAAQAADDLARAALDRRDQQTVDEAVAILDDAAHERDRIAAAAFAPANPVAHAAGASFAAHRAACLQQPDTLDRWRTAATAAAAAGLRYDAAVALVNQARLLVRRGDGGRGEAATRLREAHCVSGDIAAYRLRSQIETLARAARLSLEPAPPPPTERRNPSGVTQREAEVLTHLAAGRTYAQVAATLFISQKTVSAHVSNMLRKTGTADRVDLVAWGLRQGLVDD